MRRGAPGFTLIEMLVVISIIMILAAVLLPVYEVATKRAEAVHCSSNIRNVAVAIGVYSEDYDGHLVPARTSAGAPAVLGTGWDVLLLPYHRCEALYLCLSDQTPNWATGTTCYKHSYGINLDLTMVGGYNGASLCQNEIQSPTQTILLFEIPGTAKALGASYEVDKFSKVDVRHNTGANFAFVDGHARWMRPPETVSGSLNMWLP